VTTPDTVELEMLCVIQELQRDMKELKKAKQGLGEFRKKHGENGDRKQRVRKNTSKYCWSHGA